MKYGFLKGREVKTFKSGILDGGLDIHSTPDLIADNKVSECHNMWYKNAHLQTRPGFQSNPENSVNSKIYGYSGELEYNITDTEIYLYGRYWRIATSNVFTDDYACYIYTYLIDLSGKIKDIGKFAFMRFSSDEFYLPISLNFYSGKPQNGGGIFALITLEDEYDATRRIYNIYEINSDFTKWEKVYNYYTPTVLINGRGNNYRIAKSETGFSSAAPILAESQNMLNGKFYAYFTSDGYSSYFKLPFNNLDLTEVRCKIYYNKFDYVEWVIPSDSVRVFKMFNGREIAAIVQRDEGLIYFMDLSEDFAVPVCGENNIKITAFRKIPNGIESIVNSSCVTKSNSKLLLAGGEGGNTVYIADYDNPLYFPQNASITVGESDSRIINMSSQNDKILAFKEYKLYLLDIKEGKPLTNIILLNDNDKVFRESDSFTCEEISKRIGCVNKNTVSLCNGLNFWLSKDRKVYRFDFSGKKTTEICDCRWLDQAFLEFSEIFAFGSDEYYMLCYKDKVLVIDITDSKKAKMFLWQTPKGLNLKSGFYHSGNYWFLCTDDSTELAFMASLKGEKDDVLYYDEDNNIIKKSLPIYNGFTSKYYSPGGKNTLKNIIGISFSLAAKGRVKIAVNNRYSTELNFSFLNEDYDNHEYKSVRLSPHIYSTDGVVISFNSDKNISIGELEINYKLTD